MTDSTPATCSNGHASADQDYCSVCGVRIDGATPAPAAAEPVDPAEPAAAPTPAAAAAVGQACPNCSAELDADTRFCEVCGYDVTTGSLPEAPAVRPADPAPSADATAAPVTGTWVVIVTADRPYYDRNDVSEVQFPLGVPARSIELEGGRSHAIGRRSRSRGTNPEIDLAGPPEDPAVSHTHASLLARDDGTWELVDHGSTNGTFLNESPDPLPANKPQALAAGDRIYVGAWTRIEIEFVTGP